MLPPRRTGGLRATCSAVSVLVLDCDPAARQRRASCLRRWGHRVHSYTAASALPSLTGLPRKAVLIARQELLQESGIKCIERIQRRRPDIPAILITDDWSSALAAVVSSRSSIWLRKEPISDEELHILVDLCSA